ncbi:MAG: FAD-dependent oxidoreductase [Hyphomicrobiaceae bacterium]
MTTITEPARQVPVVAEAEVVVLGGGPAGIAAATAAARTGARTLLLERYGFLGGMGTAAMVTNICGLHAHISGSIQQIVRGVADDILARLDRLDGLRPPHMVNDPDGGPGTAAQAYDTSAYKFAADDLLVSAGVDVRFHTFGVGAVGDGARLSALIIETKSGRAAIRAESFIDCSGDADLAHWAGAACVKGDDTGFLAYPTTMFRLGNVDDRRAQDLGKPQLSVLIAEAGDAYDLPRKTGIINPQPHAGEWRCNITQISRDGDPIDGSDWQDLSFAETEGRRQVLEYFRFLKDRVPGFENAYLLETAPQIGIRETRRIVGDTVLSGDDVLSCRDFADSIGCNGWPLEQHLKGAAKWTFLRGRGYHQIPFGSTLPQGVDNLLVAGRCASTTQDGQASLRVSGPCFAMGQAVGTAAALALKQGIDPRALDIAMLQDRLRADGAFLGDADL